MRARVFAFACALVAAISLQLSAVPDRAAAQRPQIQRPTLPKEETVREVRIDETAEATGLPLPDLTVKDACLDSSQPFPFLSLLISNAGSQDAGPFEVGINYVYAGNAAGVGGRWSVDTVAGLKAGEEKWVSYSPLCCGLAASESLVKNAVKFEVVLDPTYDKPRPDDILHTDVVKSKVRESNKRNNRATFVKAEMKQCRALTPADRPGMPQIKTVKPPVRP